MLARDIMNTTVVTTAPNMTIHEAARLLICNHISGMPVVDAIGRMVGIICDSDLLHRVENGTSHDRRQRWPAFLWSSPRGQAARYVKEHGRFVSDIMCPNVISIPEDMPLAQIADLMESRHLKVVPVLKRGELVGIVSRSNLISSLVSVVATMDSASRDDASLRDAIAREMDGQRWGLPEQCVRVKEGVAHLWGVIESEEEKRAIQIAAESVAGIKRVEYHLEFPDVIPAL